MGDVVILNTVTRLDLPPDRILEAAQGRLDSCLILGWDKEGQMFFASSYADGGEVLWLMEKAKKMLMET